MKVLFFGRPADVLGRSREIALPDDATVGGVRRALAEADPAAALLMESSIRASVDRQITDDRATLTEDSEVAFFSAFSGG
ncbi:MULTISPECIES: MoaD/ThiS family protein [Hyphobacterium]|uniref:MoaD/ThiS family protein n=1 Tax=Hyphobacterium vulgare TaxID=1736751 RepID=A0ABV6ZYA1_9PROT